MFERRSEYRVGVFLAALLVMVGLVVVAPSTAASASTSCAAGQLCTYWDADFQGAMYFYTVPAGTCWQIGAPWNDNISSVYNRSGLKVTFYSGSSCDGWNEVISGCTDCQSNKLSLPWWENDTWSSFKRG